MNGYRVNVCNARIPAFFSLLPIAYGGGGEKEEGRGPLNGWMDGQMELMKFIEVVSVPH